MNKSRISLLVDGMNMDSSPLIGNTALFCVFGVPVLSVDKSSLLFSNLRDVFVSTFDFVELTHLPPSPPIL
jgi:hypothetical protein